MKKMIDSCKDRIKEHYESRIEDLKTYGEHGFSEEEGPGDYLPPFSEYGLCFDYVSKNTYEGQNRGYFRFQLSWGGPGDEFRFYVDENLEPYDIEYWFLDWFDGAKIGLEGNDFKLLSNIFCYFKELGIVEGQLREAREIKEDK